MKFQVTPGVEQGSITIPKAIWKGKNWKHGTELEFKFGPRGEVILEEAKSD